MYKLIIADDEETILHGLSKFIRWTELGFELTAVFRDGGGKFFPIWLIMKSMWS